ncbi:kinase-like domain-containing protein [Lasiosphaeris hirsuta]|uniref:Kinase-like domain-containing protein n=1 Tax=Lasiosphaeris hirsuta TaxID=260670 RepID=A0AA39ZW52_9PEZI|nr:kinase-like domain-containing protein [Lasiosphaeris hirsuta]
MTRTEPTLSELSPVESFREFRDNGLRLDGSTLGLENIHDYEPGGHHPVEIGHVLNGRFKVINKLGNGGSSNVWLCHDIQQETGQYFAVKILMADNSIEDCPELRVYRLLDRGLGKSEAAANLCLPVARFDIKGPNGRHFAIVYPVLGPQVSSLRCMLGKDDPGRELRQVCFQAVQAMATLHSYGICHGDFRPANVLARVTGLDSLTEDQVTQAVGSPRTTKVVQYPQVNSWPSTAPRDLIRSIDWGSIDAGDAGIAFVSTEACIAHFGESYDYILDKRLGIESDIWALGCTLFEIRMGRPLFVIPHDDPDEHLARMVEILGKFPEPWWSTTWEVRRRWFSDEMEGRSRTRPISLRFPLGGDNKPYSNLNDVPIARPPIPRSIQDALTYTPADNTDPCQISGHRTISIEETALFADLLKKMFRYVPEQRIAPEDILEHPWFRL